MKAHVLQHAPFESLGSIEQWLARKGADVQYTRFYQSAALPDPARVDLLIIMGGPMSVNDEQEYPWLKQEKQFIREAIRLGVPVVGVCLGAQLISSALGARVYPGPVKEIGWFPIEGLPVDAGLFHFPGRVTVFQWHGDTFELPAGATRLARNGACENQAFQLGPNVIGLQFHLEATPAAADAFLEGGRHELTDGPCIQTETAIRQAPVSAYAQINSLMDEVLEYVTRK